MTTLSKLIEAIDQTSIDISTYVFLSSMFFECSEKEIESFYPSVINNCKDLLRCGLEQHQHALMLYVKKLSAIEVKEKIFIENLNIE